LPSGEVRSSLKIRSSDGGSKSISIGKKNITSLPSVKPLSLIYHSSEKIITYQRTIDFFHVSGAGFAVFPLVNCPFGPLFPVFFFAPFFKQGISLNRFSLVSLIGRLRIFRFSPFFRFAGIENP
jgi:hypothetical protein